jgi:putative ABC transport system permease protein
MRSFPSLAVAGRRLRHSPGYTLSVIAVLALGIGAVTAIFSVVYGVLLKPYGFEQKGKLIVWHETVRELNATLPLLPVNYRHFENLNTHAHFLQSAALMQPALYTVSEGAGHPQSVPGLFVTMDFFKVLGVSPAFGQTFRPTAYEQGGDSEVILSWSAWQRYFNGDASAIGKSLRVGGSPYTVVGILPANFHFPSVSNMPGTSSANGNAYQVFTPSVPGSGERTANTDDFDYFSIGRLRPGVSIQAAQAELDGIEKATAAADHLTIHIGVVVETFGQEITGGVSKSLLLLLLSVGGVLLIGCINLANLQLARSVGQSGEQALRSALGASRGRMIREALAENLLLAVSGVLASIAVAYAGMRLLLAIAPTELPRLAQVRLSLPVLGVAVALSFATCLLFGLLPAWRAGHADPLRALQGSASRMAGEGRGAARVRQSLLILEIGGSVVLLAVTGMVGGSFNRLLTNARGLSAEPVTMAQADLSDPRYSTSGEGYSASKAARNSMIERTLAKLRALPGVQDAAVTSALPLTGSGGANYLERPDHPLPEGEAPLADRLQVSPGYFHTLGIALLAGRGFTAEDRVDSRVMIVSEKAAHAAWPNESPIGRKIVEDGETYTVIGIVADARLEDPRSDAAVFYLPFWKETNSFDPVFLIRGTGIAGPEIRQAIWSVDPQVAIPTLLPLHVQTSRALAVQRFQAVLVAAFCVAGLLLTALGVYGVLSYGVNMRMREWGVRMALGSGRVQLIRRVLFSAVRPLLAGAILGSVGAFAAGQWLSSLLYQANSADGWMLAGSLLLLSGVVLMAALPSAYRAASADPATVLRSE